MPRCRLPLSCLTLALLAPLTGKAFATTVYVGTCKPTAVHFSTIGAAITAAPAGATIDICPGTYPEQLTITKNLVLTGVQTGTGDAAILVPPASGLVQNASDIFGDPVAAQIYVEGASSVTITRLTVDGTGNNITGCSGPGSPNPNLEGIYYQNSAGTITYNVVRNQYQTDFTDYGGCQGGLAINVESLTDTGTVNVTDNSVRAYQKNGITATGAGTGPGSPGPAMIINANHVIGLGATAMNWPGGAAENGIQVGFGASGKVENNVVDDNIWFGDTSSQPYNAASGILVYASPNITITGNIVGSAQFGISTDDDPSYGPASGATITTNKVDGTQIFDAIDVCSSSTLVQGNTIFGSTESGIHLDDSCGSGDSNTVKSNIINEGCAGILLGTAAYTSITPNTFYNTPNTTLSGDACPAPTQMVKPADSRHLSKPHPSPYKPVRD